MYLRFLNKYYYYYFPFSIKLIFYIFLHYNAIVSFKLDGDIDQIKMLVLTHLFLLQTDIFGSFDTGP